MTEWLVVVVALLCFQAAWVWTERRDRREREDAWAQERGAWVSERQSLLNRLESRDPFEFAHMERAQQPRVPKERDENALQPGEHLVGI